MARYPPRTSTGRLSVLPIVTPTEAASSSMWLCRLAEAIASLDPSKVTLRAPAVARNSATLARGRLQSWHQHAPVLQDRRAARVKLEERRCDDEINHAQCEEEQKQRQKSALIAGGQGSRQHDDPASAKAMFSIPSSSLGNITCGRTRPYVRSLQLVRRISLRRGNPPDRGKRGHRGTWRSDGSGCCQTRSLGSRRRDSRNRNPASNRNPANNRKRASHRYSHRRSARRSRNPRTGSNRAGRSGPVWP